MLIGLHPAADELFERIVLIAGLGRIGQRVVAICKSFGMRVVGTRRAPEAVPSVDRVFPADRRIEHLREADFVVLALPHTADTVHFLGAAELRAMKRTAYLVNVGRGSAVDEAALVEALSR